MAAIRIRSWTVTTHEGKKHGNFPRAAGINVVIQAMLDACGNLDDAKMIEMISNTGKAHVHRDQEIQQFLSFHTKSLTKLSITEKSLAAV